MLPFEKVNARGGNSEGAFSLTRRLRSGHELLNDGREDGIFPGEVYISGSNGTIRQSSICGKIRFFSVFDLIFRENVVYLLNRTFRGVAQSGWSARFGT